MDNREYKLRHAPPRELKPDELREAFERRMLSHKLYEVELQRRELAARLKARGVVRS